MTPLRVLSVLGALWVSLIVLAAYGAWVESDPVQSAAYNHAAWMFALAGGVSAAFGVVLALIVALINDVRGGAVAGSRPCPKGRVSVPSRFTRDVAELADAREPSGYRVEGSTPSVLHQDSSFALHPSHGCSTRFRRNVREVGRREW